MVGHQSLLRQALTAMDMTHFCSAGWESLIILNSKEKSSICNKYPKGVNSDGNFYCVVAGSN